jgi:hypothetical protein
MNLFFENVILEENFDYLYIYNESYDLIQEFTGTYNQTYVTVPGNTSRIRLVTDFGIQSWGFSLSMMEFSYLPQMKQMTLASGDIYDGNWTAIIPKQGNVSQIYLISMAFDLAGNPANTPFLNYLSSENTLPTILDVIQTPSGAYIHPSNTPEISARITDNYGIFLNGIILQYSTSGSWSNLTMIPSFNDSYTTDGRWNASIPAFPEGTNVDYRIIVQDFANNRLISSNYSYFVDGTAPNLEYSSQTPGTPEYNDTVTVKLTLTDLLASVDGSGIDSVVMDYSYSNDYSLESDHPYPNNYNNSWTITHTGALGIAVHFTQINLFVGDKLEIYDGNGQLIQSFTSTVINNQWSLRTNTEKIELRLTSNSFMESYGFKIDKYRAYYNNSMNKVSGTIFNGVWSGIIPANSYGTTVWYDITVEDRAGNIDTVLSDSYTIADTYNPQVINFEISTPAPTPDDDVNLTIQVSEPGSGIKNITLWISLDGGLNWIQVPFLELSTTWYVTIPRQPDGTTIKYFVRVHDNSGNCLRNPISGSYTMTFSAPDEAGLGDWLLILIMVIGFVGAISFLLFLRNRSTIKTLEESAKQKSTPKTTY